MKKMIVTLLLGCSMSLSCFAVSSLKVHNVAEMDQKMELYKRQYIQSRDELLKTIDPSAKQITPQQSQRACHITQIYFNNLYNLMDQNRDLLKPDKRTFTREQLKAMISTRAGLSLKQLNCNLI